MNNEELKQLINRMLDAIEDNQQLLRIFRYIHKQFIRRTGE